MTNKREIILGLDPGMRTTGWGLIEGRGNNFKHIANGFIKPNVQWKIEKRLENIFLNLQTIIAKYEPSQAAVEKIFVNINAQSSIKLGQVRGVILLSLSIKNILVGEYSPNQIKKSVTGYGHASKQQMLKILDQIFPNIKIHNEDSGDALAVAVCHAMNFKFSLIKEKYG